MFSNKSSRYLLLLLLLAIAAPAAAQIPVTMPDTTAAAGDSLCIPVVAGDVTGQNIVAFQLTVTFDPLVVNAAEPYYDASAGLAAGWTVLESHNNTTGTIQIGGFGTTPLTGSGALLCLRMRVLPGLSNGTISPLTFSAFTFNEGTPAAGTTGGSVTVQNPPPPPVSVSLPDTSVLVNTQVCVPVLLGDVTGDSITAFEFTVTFNPALVNVASPYYNTADGLAAGWTILETHDNNAGNIHIGGFGTEPLAGQGQLLCLVFQPLLAAPNGSVSPLTFTGFVFNEGSPSVLTDDGTLTTLCPVPPQVTGVAASDNRCDDVLITWNNVAGEDSFQIRRNGSRIGKTSADSLSFSDVTAVVGTTYAYTVIAYNLCGAGAESLPDSGHRITVPPQVPAVTAADDRCPDVLVTWGNVAGEDSFQVRRDGNRIGTTLADVLTYTDASAVPGVLYAYTVAAYNTCGQGLLSLPDYGTRRDVPPQVTNINASDSTLCNAVSVSWSDVAGETDYRIRRNGLFLITIGANGTSYTDTSAVPWTNYSYTVTAFNECGDGVVSAVDSGTRKGVPEGTAISASDNEFCTHVRACWSAAPHATGYRLKRNGIVLATLGSAITCYDDSTVAAGTVYNYSVVPFNDCGDGPESAVDNGRRRTVPASLSSFTASDNACDRVNFAWSGVPADADSFRFFRDGNPIGAVPADSTHFSDTPPPGTYTYSMCAYNACGNGPTLTDSGTRLTTLAQVSGVNASDNLCATVLISWNNIAGEDSFQIRRNGVRVGSVAANVLLFADVPPSGTYSYRVVAYNACGAGDSTGTDSGTRLPSLPVVTNVQATDNSCANIIVTWSDVAGEDSFQVRRNGVRIGSVGANVTLYTDTPAPGTYTYRVVAYNVCGAGDSAGFDSGTRLPVLPAVPSVQATDNSCVNVIVTWNNIAGEDSFQVRRDGVRIGSVAANVTLYTDAPPPGTYTYRVVAYNTCGAGDSAGTATGTRPTTPSATTVTATDQRCDNIIVTWSDLADEDSFFVERNHVLIARLGQNVTLYTDFPITGSYLYTVYGWNSCGNGAAASDSGRKRESPGVPTGLDASDMMCDLIHVTWTAAPGEVDRYRIYRDQVLIDSTTAIFYDDHPGDSRAHAYYVSAYNTTCGAGTPSVTDSGRERSLTMPQSDLPDTVNCRDTVTILLEHCDGVLSDSFFISYNGSAYEFLAAFSPVQDTVDVIVPVRVVAITPHCTILLKARRGLRVDSLISPEFTIQCVEDVIETVSGLIPADFFLDQNYPNPFNPSTRIRFGLPRATKVTMEIFDVLGRKTYSFASDILPPGVHSIYWNCSGCPSGMYLIRMQAADRVLVRKMLLMK